MKSLPCPGQLPLFPLDKRCSKCGETKALEAFTKNRARSDGLSHYCKPCGTAHSRASKLRYAATGNAPERNKLYRERHIDRVLTYNRIYMRTHKAELSAKAKAKRQADLEGHRARDRAAYHADPAKAIAQVLAYQARNISRVRERNRLWLRGHRAYMNDYNRARNARKRANGGSFTHHEWRDLCAKYGNKCLACGATGVVLTVDHIVPVSKGGRGDIDSVQPLCLPCNSRKHDQTIDYRPTPGNTLTD